MTIILLNGTSSSGKSSLAKTLQNLILKEPYIHTGIDPFFDMLPKDYIHFGPHSKEGIGLVKESDFRGPVHNIVNGPLGMQFYRSIVHATKVMADNGHNLIVDEVLFEDEILKEYIVQLQEHTVYLVGVLCRLEVLEDREFLRSNRARFLARPQLKRVHGPTRIYDLLVDTTTGTITNTAQQIANYITANPPKAAQQLQRIFRRSII